MTNSAKIARSGVVTSVPPGMRFTRAFDQRSHPYQGYILRVRGSVGREACELSVANGEAAPLASVHSRYTTQRRSRASKCAQVRQPSDLSGEFLFAHVLAPKSSGHAYPGFV
jgi:hypothetical protein